MSVAIVALLAVAVAAALVVGYERTVRVLRTELNQSRANEQLLLTRLASRTPAEFHSAVAANESPDPVVPREWLTDPTGLIEVELGAED